MFYICKKREGNLGVLYGVFDSKDGVVEYYRPKDIIRLVKESNIKIEGVIKKPDGKWTLKVMQPKLLEEVTEDLVDYEDSDSTKVNIDDSRVVNYFVDSAHKIFKILFDGRKKEIFKKLSEYGLSSWDLEACLDKTFAVSHGSDYFEFNKGKYVGLQSIEFTDVVDSMYTACSFTFGGSGFSDDTLYLNIVYRPKENVFSVFFNIDNIYNPIVATYILTWVTDEEVCSYIINKCSLEETICILSSKAKMYK